MQEPLGERYASFVENKTLHDQYRDCEFVFEKLKLKEFFPILQELSLSRSINLDKQLQIALIALEITEYENIEDEQVRPIFFSLCFHFVTKAQMQKLVLTIKERSKRSKPFTAAELKLITLYTAFINKGKFKPLNTKGKKIIVDAIMFRDLMNPEQASDEVCARYRDQPSYQTCITKCFYKLRLYSPGTIYGKAWSFEKNSPQLVKRLIGLIKEKSEQLGKEISYDY